MRKGFSATLATVAFAMLGVHAMAMAPTISEIPDIIVGDAEDTSAANVFVFPEALNLNTLVSDDETSDGGIIWSYYVGGAGGVYRINDTDPVPDPGDLNNIVNPPSAQRIELNQDPGDGDADARTITIRDIQASPLPAQASYGDPAGGPGILPDSRVITLFASDGSTVTLDNAQSFIVYSDDDGFDRYSGGSPEDIVYDEDDPGINWTGVDELGSGNASMSQPGGSACFTTPTGADKLNLFRYYSDYGAVQVAPNTVYEARLEVSTDQTTVDETPVWSWVWDNISADGTLGSNEYGGEYFFIDNVGGANSPISGVGRSDYSVYMIPPQGQTSHFLDETNGFFRNDVEQHRHMRLNFRLFDYSDGGYGAEADNGSICLDGVTVVAHDISDMQVDETVYEVTDLVDGDPLTADSWSVEALGDPTTTEFNGGDLSVSPNTSWTNPTVINVNPGDQTADIGTGADIADNWPIEWNSDELFYIEFMLSAPDATAEANPPDVIQVGADVPTSELTMLNFLVYQTQDPSAGAAPNRGVSMPRAGAPQPYVAFFTTHSQTASAVSNHDRWRPRLQIINSNALSAHGRTDNTGGIVINSVRVQRVSF